MDRLEILQDVVKNGARKVKIGRKMVLVDRYTASAVLELHHAINPENKKELLSMEWTKMVNLTWKVLNKNKTGGQNA